MIGLLPRLLKVAPVYRVISLSLFLWSINNVLGAEYIISLELNSSHKMVTYIRSAN